jgi:predicted ATPase
MRKAKFNKRLHITSTEKQPLLIHLKRREWPERLNQVFPFYLQIVKNLETLTFTEAVTFFVGENGSGKSTLLEAIACAANLPTIGSANIGKDPTLEPINQFADYIQLAWRIKKNRGFFLRAEDFFGFAKRMTQAQHELQDDLNEAERVYSERSDFAKMQAKMAYTREIAGLVNRYGNGLDSQSHGEGFLKLFQARFVPNGLYLLDEPEAPLSPLRQLAFMAQMREMIKQGSQFIISTHSPILMAFPSAEILSFDGSQIHSVPYPDIEHVVLTRSFLNNPESYLNYLWDE